MDDQERLAQALKEIQNAAREARVMSLVREVVASNPSPPRVSRQQTFSAEPPPQILCDLGDDGFEIATRMVSRRQALILIVTGIIVLALLAPLGLLLLRD
jgi:hypothetical protein